MTDQQPVDTARSGQDPTEPSTPSGWLLCSRCEGIVYRKAFARAGNVCPECGWHAPLTADERVSSLLDGDSVDAWQASETDHDPLGFVDTRPYPERIADARTATGLQDAVLCARGTIDGHPVVVAALDFRFLGGSLGSAVGEAVTGACEVALRERLPLLLVTASGGARMQEGIVSLMQMAKTSQAIGQLDEAGVLTISLVTDPTYGGVAASFATLCDVIVAEPGARLGFAGPRVIEQTIRQTLPEGFQTAEFLLDHGVIDMVTPRPELRTTLARLLSASSQGDPASSSPVAPAAATPIVRDAEEIPPRDPWEVVGRARSIGRPTTLEYAALMVDEFVELHGDRISADCPALVGGLGRLGTRTVVLIGTQKGHNASDLAARNYGMPSPAGYRKAARLMRLAAKLGLPVVTLVDTAGAYPGISAEREGQSVAIAENIRLMAGLTVPTVAVITGEGGSGGALALAVADRVLMCSNAVYSVISPEGCASILWKDPAEAPRAAAALQVDSRALLDRGIVDGVVPEPEHGADGDHLTASHAVSRAVLDSLDELSTLTIADLLVARRSRFRRFGISPEELGEPTVVPDTADAHAPADRRPA